MLFAHLMVQDDEEWNTVINFNIFGPQYNKTHVMMMMTMIGRYDSRVCGVCVDTSHKNNVITSAPACVCVCICLVPFIFSPIFVFSSNRHDRFLSTISRRTTRYNVTITYYYYIYITLFSAHRTSLLFALSARG